MKRFEEYKLFVEDTARFSDRRQTVSNIYVTVNSLILAAVAFLAKDAGLVPLWRVPVVLLMLGVGAVVCFQWCRLIDNYKKLVGFRMEQHQIMEDMPDMEDSYRMFHKEQALYPTDEGGNSGKGLNISDLEKMLPRIFIGVYFVFLVGFIVVLVIAPDQLGRAP